MAATATAPPPLSASGNGGPEDSNVSSPLSEVDTEIKDGDTDQIHVAGDEADVSPHNDSTRETHPNSPTESALSEADSDLPSEAEDTEAETERLYDTPKNHRQRDVVVDQFNNGRIVESTPSKLRRSAAVDLEDANGKESSVISDESPTKPTRLDGDESADAHERKRKRSFKEETSESDQPLRKRTGSVVAEDNDTADGDNAEQDDEALGPRSGVQSGEEEGGKSPQKHTSTISSDARDRRTRSSKATRKSTRRTGTADDVGDETESTSKDEVGDEEGERTAADQDAEVEDEADAAARSAEELEKKLNAFKDWTHIEELFGVFRDRLYRDRLERLEEEEQSLLSDTPTHPEFLNMRKCLDDRLDHKNKMLSNELQYQITAHKKRAVAQHAQIWSQFYQAVRERREQALEKLNKEWYDVQTARRSAHSLPDFGLLFPKDETQRIKNAIAYNTEVSILSGMAKYEGFPSGPEISGASTSELENDLNAMQANRRGRQKPLVQAREDYQVPAFNRLGPAGEQFLKDTPWANPNHSAHRLYQQPSQTVAAATTTTTNNQVRAPPSLSATTAVPRLPGSMKGAFTTDKPGNASRRASEQTDTPRATSQSSLPTKKSAHIIGAGRGTKATAV